MTSMVTETTSSIRSMVPPRERSTTTSTMRIVPTQCIVDASASVGRRPVKPAISVTAAAAASAGPGELHESEKDIDGRPEPRPRPEAQESPVNGLSRVERVADAFQVEDQLQDDGNGHHAHDRSPILHGGRRPREPLPAADTCGQQNRARPDHAPDIAEVDRWRRRQVIDLPGWQMFAAGFPACGILFLIHWICDAANLTSEKPSVTRKLGMEELDFCGGPSQPPERPLGVLAEHLILRGVACQPLEPGDEFPIAGVPHGNGQVPQPATILCTLQGRETEELVEVRLSQGREGIE